jgi:energy-coupling factor transport system substrate-specific component
MKTNKLTVADLILTGVYTAIYFILVFIATLVSSFLPGLSNVFLPALAALISGSVYMLFVAKLQKFGGITIMGCVMGIFFFVSGHFFLSFAANIVFGIIADYVASIGKYKSKKYLMISYVLFSYGLTGPILPLWFMKDAYLANLTARGKSVEYITNVFSFINTGSFFICLISILVCAIIGGLFGMKMVRKHFVKAGIVA